MTRRNPTRRSMTGMTLLKIAAFFLVVGVALYSALMMLVDRSDERSNRAWDEEFGTLELRLADYPQRSVNREALQMQLLAAPLGITLEPRDPVSRAIPSVEHAIQPGLREQMGEYLDARLSAADAPIEPPGDELAAYLEDKRAHLAEMREFLLSNPTPYWTRDLERVFSGPFYNPVGHVDLHRVLLVDALDALAAEDGARALENVEASWRFLGALREDVYLETLASVFRMAQRQAAIVRRIEDPGPVWIERFDPLTLRRPAVDGLKHFGWVWGHVDDTIRWNSNMHVVRKVASIAIKPYVQLCEIDTIAEYRPNLGKLLELDHLCDRDLEALGIELDWHVPWWNQMGDHVSFTVRDFVDLWRQLEFDYEATLVRLEAVYGREGWTARDSRVCPADRWEVHTTSGRTELVFSREPNWPGVSGGLASPSRVQVTP